MQAKVCAFMTRLKRKDGTFSGVSPWLALLLVLVMLGMNYQTAIQLERAEMEKGLRRIMRVKTTKRGPRVPSPRGPVVGATSDENATKTPLYLPIPPRQNSIVKDLVKKGDYIYYHEPNNVPWDASPIVIESHKLVFFTIPKVGCTVWKQLFRRMMGYEDWQSQDYSTFLPHNPHTNGLKYLFHYSLEQASEMMTSPEWTRAIMVRDPKMRFLSSMLDKSVSNDHLHIIRRCCPDRSCVDDAQTIPGFLRLVQTCDDEHWRGQHERVDTKYWPYMDRVLHVETAAQDAKVLLKKIGAWEEFGQSGWGADGTQSIFGSTEVEAAGEHATWSQWKVWQWYTPESEKMVERYYQADYMNPLFHFERNSCFTCIEKKDL